MVLQAPKTKSASGDKEKDLQVDKGATLGLSLANQKFT